MQDKREEKERKGTKPVPGLQPQPETITLEEYEALPEDTRAEVFDGQSDYMAFLMQLCASHYTEWPVFSAVGIRGMY